MSTLVFATRNPGKVAELVKLLPGVAVLSLDEVGVEVAEVEEDGETFVANAIKKAVEVSRQVGLPALADDSGLEVDALDGRPGVYSARFAGEDADDAANNRKLLAELEGVEPGRRTARFRSALALADVAGPLAEPFVSEGSCEGEILGEPRGTGGFGYDPLFLVPALGKTFAELGVGTKNDLSHRAVAMRAMKPRLLEYLEQLAKRPGSG